MTKLGAGGISTLTVNINSLLDRSKVRFDYLVFENEKTFYEEKIEALGARKVIVDVKRYQNKKLLLYFQKYLQTKRMLKQNQYDVVHVDASTPMDVVIGLAAKHAGVKVRILHSHIAGDNKHSLFRNIYLNICRKMMLTTFTDYFAISEISARFMFPRKISSKKNYTIIKNGIVAEKYAFDLVVREQLRKELKLENNFTLGHVGRFSAEKNHLFMLDIFKIIKEKKDNARLLLIGDGALRHDIENKIHALELEDSVILYGTTQDVPRLMMAMDAFVFPSRFEGLGIAAIEAQCSGLQTFCSNGIPDETNITELFHRINGYDPAIWANEILNVAVNPRVSRVDDVKKAGFDLCKVANQLQNFYLKGYFDGEGIDTGSTPR